VVRAVKLLDLRTKRLVAGQFGGAYRAVFKGHGIEFAELREYQPGDEVRTIDWKVTARMRRPHVRRFVEERELSVLVVLDVSGSAWVGTRRQLKAQVAAELTAALVLAAARQNDRVGVLAVSDRLELLRPPRKGRRHALALARDVLALAPARRPTLLAPAADAAGPALPQRGIVFVVSDFDAPDAERTVRRLAMRHEVIAVPVDDPADDVLPNVGVARLADPETGAGIEVDTSDPAVRAVFARRARAARDARDRMLQAAGADLVTVTTDGGFLDPMLRYLQRRAGRGRR
jgi:uncharacterized protein (DUF58 family)